MYISPPHADTLLVGRMATVADRSPPGGHAQCRSLSLSLYIYIYIYVYVHITPACRYLAGWPYGYRCRPQPSWRPRAVPVSLSLSLSLSFSFSINICIYIYIEREREIHMQMHRHSMYTVRLGRYCVHHLSYKTAKPRSVARGGHGYHY